ncbi:MAG: DNA polymerase IV [Proteobacteria bacterium]|nr:DNA polymerase IV [Pseudomonadota bacterium]
MTTTRETSSIKKRTIIHIDMDAFYASVEILDHPELQGKPVIVGGLSDRSVVSASSYEARKYGVFSAMPITRARALCPDGIFLPVRMERYREISGRIMAIFNRFTPLVEAISLDEAFLDVTGSERLFGSGAKIAATIKDLIHKEEGLTASAGVAASKLVAKIASDLQKPDGLTIVPPGTEKKFLAPLPVKRLWGVGKTTLQALAMMNVRTIGDIAKLSEDFLAVKFGKHGTHLYYTANGIDTREVVPTRMIKSVGHEDTFATDITDKKTIHRELLSLAVRVGERLRRYGLTGKTITIKVKFHDFKTASRSLTLEKSTDDGNDIFRTGKILLEKTEAVRKPLRLLGISVSNLSEAGKNFQMDLFGAKHENRKTELNKAVDAINRKFGREKINPASLIKLS